MKANIKIKGMHCGSCAKIIAQELTDAKGIKNVSVSFASSLCNVEFDETVLPIKNIKEQIKKLGFQTD